MHAMNGWMARFTVFKRSLFRLKHPLLPLAYIFIGLKNYDLIIPNDLKVRVTIYGFNYMKISRPLDTPFLALC